MYEQSTDAVANKWTTQENTKVASPYKFSQTFARKTKNEKVKGVKLDGELSSYLNRSLTRHPTLGRKLYLLHETFDRRSLKALSLNEQPYVRKPLSFKSMEISALSSGKRHESSERVTILEAFIEDEMNNQNVSTEDETNESTVQESANFNRHNEVFKSVSFKSGAVQYGAVHISSKVFASDEFINRRQTENVFAIRETNKLLTTERKAISHKNSKTTVTKHISVSSKPDDSVYKRLRFTTHLPFSQSLQFMPKMFQNRRYASPNVEHDLRQPVSLNEHYDQRKPVSVNEDHNLREPLIPNEDHDQRWPVLEEDTHDQRLPEFNFIGVNEAYLASITPEHIDSSPDIQLEMLGAAVDNVENTVASPQVQDGNRGKNKPSFSESTTNLKVLSDDILKICGRPTPGVTRRILGGQDSPYLSSPWMISIHGFNDDLQNYKHRCGAVLLNHHWAVTAAHCFSKVSMDKILLKIGAQDFKIVDINYPSVERKVKEVVIHPGYKRTSTRNDIALMKFDRPIEIKRNIIPLCLPSRDLRNITGQMATMSGWGYTVRPPYSQMSSTLQEVTVPILSNDECEEMLQVSGYNVTVEEMYVCAGVQEGGLDSCFGDSGGPLSVKRDGKYMMVGLISWGFSCGKPQQPGINIRITEFLEWIERIIAIY